MEENASNTVLRLNEQQLNVDENELEKCENGY